MPIPVAVESNIHERDMSDLRTSNPKAATAESPTGSAAHDVVLDLKARIGKPVLG